MQREKIKSWITAEQARELVHTPERILEIIYQQIREKAQAGGRKILVQDFGFDRIQDKCGPQYSPMQKLVIDTLEKDQYKLEIVCGGPNCVDCGLRVKW